MKRLLPHKFKTSPLVSTLPLVSCTRHVHLGALSRAVPPFPDIQIHLQLLALLGEQWHLILSTRGSVVLITVRGQQGVTPGALFHCQH